MTFQEYRDKISIGEMAEHLGYKRDPGGGRTYLCYYLGTPDRKEDEIVIYNPNIPGKNTYFSRKGNDKGNLINFILNRLERFPFTTKSGLQGVNEVLDTYINGASHITKTINSDKRQISSPKFNYTYWDPQPLSDSNNPYLTKIRKLSPETVADFQSKLHIYLVGKSNHIGFPFRHPGQMEITNFELRNYFAKDNVNFKGFCTGGDKSTSCWVANFVPFNEVDSIYLFESAIDAMSFYEIKHFNRLTKSCFISVGGHVTQGQIKALKEAFPNVTTWYCCYDKDAAGQCFDVATSYYLAGKECKTYTKPAQEGGTEIHITIGDKSYTYHDTSFSSKTFLEELNQNNIKIIKTEKYKDWNELLHYYKSFESNLKTLPFANAIKEAISSLNLRGHIQLSDAITQEQQHIIAAFMSQKSYMLNDIVLAESNCYAMSASNTIYMGFNNLIIIPQTITITNKLTQNKISGQPFLDFLKKNNVNIYTLFQEDLKQFLHKGTITINQKQYKRSSSSAGWVIKENLSNEKQSCENEL